MCERCNDPDHLDFPEPGRRKFLKGGAGLAASCLHRNRNRSFARFRGARKTAQISAGMRKTR